MNHKNATSTETTPSARGSVAILLSFVAPGLGLVYAGRLMAGLVLNLLFVLFVLLFVIASTLFQFFPFYPALVLAMLWLVMCALSAWRSVELIGDDEARRGRPFQHPLIYLLIALATFAAPLAVTYHFTARHLITVVPIEDPALYPQAKPGDHLLVDRTAYRSQAPRRGDVVTVRIPDSDELAHLRVVGLPTERISMDGFVLEVDQQAAHYSPLDSEAVNTAIIDTDSTMEFWVEHNDDQRYVISSLVGAPTEGINSELELAEDEYFLLADHRSAIDADGDRTHLDSRHLGALSARYIEGRPIYVGWSSSEETGDVQWERIGLPIH